MYSLKSFFDNEPVALSAAVLATVNLLALFGVFTVTAEQLAALDTALVLGFGLFQRHKVTPTSKL